MADKLQQLRQLLQEKGLHAYVVPHDDAHMSEYIGESDMRLAYISNFTGSAGTGVITLDKAALWTDGRYFLQAGKELDSNWTLMKDRLPETPSVESWLQTVLPRGSSVGIDPSLFSIGGFRNMQQALTNAGIDLVSVISNLVDEVWGKGKPAPSMAKAFVHPLKYSGEESSFKISRLRSILSHRKADALVVAALDEIAWLFNIRGCDIDFNPVVFSYAIITTTASRLYVHLSKIDAEVKKHLEGVQFFPYEQVFVDLQTMSAEGKVIWVDPMKTNQALANCINQSTTIEDHSPITLMKALKNEVELEGLRQCHLRDAAALISYFAWLEDALQAGTSIYTEFSAAQKLHQFRSQQQDFVSLSFETISSVGPNAAIIHYAPQENSAAVITKDQIYLCDSGGQYRDGTTDVTRTLHFGTPTAHEKRCFTRVLQGHIALDIAIFPKGTTGHKLDVLARLPLWADGLDYRHGTGHGVGAFLNVHEGPQGIHLKETATRTPLLPGMTMTDEPGYYEDGAFGIRIENVLFVRKVDTPNQFATEYYGFEHVTWVPIQTKLLDVSIMSPGELAWVDQYNQSCLEKVGPLLQSAPQALAWLKKETRS